MASAGGSSQSPVNVAKCYLLSHISYCSLEFYCKNKLLCYLKCVMELCFLKVYPLSYLFFSFYIYSPYRRILIFWRCRIAVSSYPYRRIRIPYRCNIAAHRILLFSRPQIHMFLLLTCFERTGLAVFFWTPSWIVVFPFRALHQFISLEVFI